MPYAHPIIAQMDRLGYVRCPSCFEASGRVSERDFDNVCDFLYDGETACEVCHRPYPVKTVKVEVRWDEKIPILYW